MGIYTPGKPAKPRTLSETLVEAEEDHFLDCPTADYPVRAAALLLDVIFFSLANSGIQNFFDTIESYALHVLHIGTLDPTGRTIALIALYLALVTKVTAGYLYFIWSINRFRGSAGKLLLGLRVVSSQTGQPLRPSVALLRETVGKAASVLSVVGIILPLFRDDVEMIHDKLAQSVVKKLHGGPIS